MLKAEYIVYSELTYIDISCICKTQIQQIYILVSNF